MLLRLCLWQNWFGHLGRLLNFLADGSGSEVYIRLERIYGFKANSNQRQIQDRLMDALRVQYVNLEQIENQQLHKTDGLSSDALVVRRGQPFKLTLVFNRPYRLNRDSLVLRVELDRLFNDIPITLFKNSSQSQWAAYLQQGSLESTKASVHVTCPANAPVGVYQLLLMSPAGPYSFKVGQLALLCNPWCPADSVYISDESQRQEYVRNDFGLLYQGTAKNINFRPWSFDQYERGILDICMMMLQVSTEHKRNWRSDYLNRADPVYISRVVSAMINSNDDCGVLLGNWSEDYSGGVHPSEWTGSREILKQWAQTRFSPVKYGQCWVFAGVMCTVMRALGIPARVVTNFDSAHDTNGNLVIEEFYTETGEKLPRGQDSIWNFHVWVECWMKRADLGGSFDGWQVLDPTPQERSGGMFRCGPAPVKAIREKRMDMPFDIPFIYAEVNADVCVCIVRQGQVMSSSIDTSRVGSFICTKSLGSNRPQDITSTYKYGKGEREGGKEQGMATPAIDNGNRTAKGLSVMLSLLKAPVMGGNISFSVTVTNKEGTPKTVREHVNAQAKSYNRSPSDAFWDAHNTIQLAANESKVLQHQISYSRYAGLGDGQLINLAAVVMDVATQESVLASEEFNLTSPVINIRIADEVSIVAQRQQVAMVTFANPFSEPVSGVLTVAGAGLLDDKVLFNVALQPGENMEISVNFTPKMTGVKMLHASLRLNDSAAVIRGFRTITVQPA
ncbi:transglutaminase 5, like [Salminus brasiliensis]|uniref:transglutaminase 5, like n=1 Tax=Salminus brasiliensis TaxID=930266 RepID=UPI003B83666F